MRSNSVIPSLVGVVLAAALCSPPAAWAAAIWVGGVDNNFNNTANWDDSKDPTGEACYFYWGTPTYVDLNVGSPISVYSLATTYTGGTVGTAPVTISGEQMSLTGPTGITTGSQGRGLTINSNLAISGTAEQTWDVGSDPVAINGGVSGAYDFGIKKAGTGTLSLNGVGAFGAASQAGLTIDGGKVILGNEAALGANGTYRGGALTVRSGSSWDSSMSGAHTLTSNNTLTLYESGGGTFTFVGSNSLNMGTGGAYLNSASTPGTFNLVVNANELTIGGDVEIRTGSSLKKDGAGALTLMGATTSTVGMYLNAGRLNIGNAATLGTGTITIRGDTTWDNAKGSDMTLSTNNNMTFYEGNGGTFTFAGTNSLNMGTGEVYFNGGTGAYTHNLVVDANELTFGGPVELRTGNSLWKRGAGTLTLNGPTTSTSGSQIVIDEGRLNIGHANVAGGGNLVFKASTTFDATSDLTLSMAAGRVVNFYGGDDFTEFTFAGSHNLSMGANGVVVQAGNAHVNVVANTLTLGGNVEGDSNNLYKSGDGTLVLGGGATNNGLISDKGTLVLGAAADIKGETIMGSGVTAVWVTGNGDAYDATYKVEFDGTKSVSNHDVRSQLSAYPGTGIVSLRAQVFSPDTPTGDLTMQWRERSAPDIAALAASNVLDLAGSAIPSKYLLTMTYDPSQLAGDEAALASAGLISIAYKSGGAWVSTGTSFQGDSALPTTVAGFDALAALSVGAYGVDSVNDIAWVVLDHASEFTITSVPEPGSVILSVTGLIGLLVYGWRRRK